MSPKEQFYIEKLNLLKHPEGGYYNEIYRADEIYKSTGLPDRYSGDRVFSTSIYFLLGGRDRSYFHRLKSDEIWHFYDGCSVRIYLLDEGGKLSQISLGKNISSGEVLQAVIRHGCWFAAEPQDKNSFVLVGCTVSPGFEFEDFEFGRRRELLERFPEHKDLIVRFTSP